MSNFHRAGQGGRQYLTRRAQLPSGVARKSL